MKVCIPTTSKAGLNARVSPHFGKSPFFTLVEVEAARISSLTNDHAQDAEGRCHAAEALVGLAVDAVVCRGMGATARATLRDLGLAVLDTEAWTVAEVVRELHEGTSPALHPQG